MLTTTQHVALARLHRRMKNRLFSENHVEVFTQRAGFALLLALWELQVVIVDFCTYV